MLDHKDEDYANTYKYCYEVEAPETRKAKMDFCPVLCQDYLDRINKKYLPEEIAKEFAKMYAGYEQNSSLLTLLGLEPSDKEEFIADSNVKVIRKCDESLTEDINIVSLKQEIKQAVRERFSGLDEEDYNDLIGDYLYVDIIPINNFQTRVEVRAQLPYTQMDKLANKLDLIIQKYDDSAYFDHEDLGIITAYLKTDAYRKWHKKEDVELLEALSIEDAKRKIDQSPYQITIKAEAEDEFKDFLLSKNISFIIDDHLTAYGKHGKNSTFHLKYPKHKDLTEDTHLINSYYIVDSDGEIKGDNLTREEARELTNKLKETAEDYIYVTRNATYEVEGSTETDFEDIIDVDIHGSEFIVHKDLFKLFSNKLQEGRADIYTQLEDEYFTALSRAEEKGIVTFTVDKDGEQEDEFDSFDAAVEYAKEIGKDKIHVSSFGECYGAYCDGEYEEHDEHVLDLNRNIVEKLIQSSSEEAFKKNVETEIEAGKDPKQAVAIAHSVKEKNEDIGEETIISDEDFYNIDDDPDIRL